MQQYKNVINSNLYQYKFWLVTVNYSVIYTVKTGLYSNESLLVYLHFQRRYLYIFYSKNLKLFSLLTAKVFHNKNTVCCQILPGISQALWQTTSGKIRADHSTHSFWIQEGKKAFIHLRNFLKFKITKGEESWTMCLTYSWGKTLCSFYSIFLLLQGI